MDGNKFRTVKDSNDLAALLIGLNGYVNDNIDIASKDRNFKEARNLQRIEHSVNLILKYLESIQGDLIVDPLQK